MILTEEPTKDVNASMGGTMNWRELDPDPHLKYKHNIRHSNHSENTNVDSPNRHCPIITLVQVSTMQIRHLRVLAHYRDGPQSLQRHRQAPRCDTSWRRGPTILEKDSGGRCNFSNERGVCRGANRHIEVTRAGTVRVLRVKVDWWVSLSILIIISRAWVRDWQEITHGVLT